MTVVVTVCWSQSLNQKIQQATALSENGEFAKADQLLNEALQLSTNTEQELSIYQLLYENSRQAEQQRLFLSVSKNLANRSTLFNGELFREVKGLLAEQAYLFNSISGGYDFDDEIYHGMYFALKEYGDPLTRTNHVYDSPGDIFIINTRNSDYFYTIHQNGSLLKWTAKGDIINSSIFSSFWKMMTVKTVEVSKDKTELFMAGTLKNKAFAEIIDMRDLSRKASLTELGSSIVDASYRNADEIYLLDNYGGSISLYKNGKNTTVVTPASKLRSIAVNNSGNLLYGAGTNGNLYVYDIDDNYSVSTLLSANTGLESLRINENDSIIAVGDSQGIVYLNINNRWTTLVGHTAGVLEMAFSPDEKLFATASADRTIRVYKLDDLAKEALVFTDNNNKVTSLAFTQDNRRLIAGTYNRAVKSWPVDIKDMGGRICNYVTRNMSSEEWKRYVGEDIAYQKTCNDINTNEIHD